MILKISRAGDRVRCVFATMGGWQFGMWTVQIVLCRADRRDTISLVEDEAGWINDTYSLEG
jgi:hypothetical protein